MASKKKKSVEYRSLGNTEDVKTSQNAVSDQGGQVFLKIPEKKTPFYLMDLKYRDGFAHWVELPNGRRTRVVCAGGVEQGGFAPDDCPICAYTMDLYKQARDLRDAGDDVRADRLKKKANGMRAKYEAHFIAVRGEREIVREKGKKQVVANFDIDDPDTDVELGILALSHSQYLKLTGLIDDPKYPFIESGVDLGEHVLWSHKEKKAGKAKGQTFTEVSWTPDPKVTPKPDIEYDPESEELDISHDFDVDFDQIDKVYAQLNGEDADDEEVDMEGDSAEDVDDDFFDDDDDADEVAKDIIEAEEDDPEDDFLDDVEEDDFEDDIPYEEEESVKKKPRATKPGTRAVKGKARTRSSRAKL